MNIGSGEEELACLRALATLANLRGELGVSYPMANRSLNPGSGSCLLLLRVR
jgi:hypothetical protein